MFHLLSGTFFFYWEETGSHVQKNLYDSLCARTLPWPTTILCIQFSSWVQIFAFNFERVLEKIRSEMTSSKRTNSKWFSDGTLSKLNHELKMVLRLKEAIVDTYGSSILLNQLYTFICLILNCTLLINVEVGTGRMKDGWFRYYFVARIIYYATLSYIPHWIGQIAFSEVSSISS